MLPRTLLYVHASDELYGADVILLQLLDQLPRAAWRPLVVIPTDVAYEGRLTEELAQRGIDVVHYPTAILRRKYFTPVGLLRYFWRLILSTLFLARLIRREQVCLVHSNTTAVIPGALAARLTRTPHIWHIHEIITRPRFLWKTTAWLIPRLSAQVVAVSTPTRDHLCAGSRLNQQRAVVIHNGIDVQRFTDQADAAQAIRQAWGVPTDAVLVGMVGRFSHWKGQAHFLQAAALAAQAHPTAWFALVGGVFPGQEGLVTEVKQLARSLGLADRVIFSDFRTDIPAVLTAYDIFVLPSTEPDPFPTVVLEAMAAACPVVANAHGGSLEMVQDQETGYLVHPTDTAAMAAAISRLAADGECRQRLGAAGQARLRQRYSLEAFTAKWLALYAELASGE